jgi:phosphatidylserine/phosphatidylglycerophosphate/cardiolipin synthase-like enzyme
MSQLYFMRDREYLLSLQCDIETASVAHICTVRLTNTVSFLFGNFLKRGGQLYVLTNAIHRWPENLRQVIDEVTKLRSLGAHITHYNAPYLLHSKIVALAPGIVYIGSHNLTGQSLGRNIERSVRVTGPAFYEKVVHDLCNQGGWPI